MADINASKTSPARIKPYLEKNVPCPICQKHSIQPEVKSRLFVERDRDVDLKPKTYLWAIKDLESCHPPLYYMWSCPSCQFTSSNFHYTSPAKAHNLLSSSFSLGIKLGASRKNYSEILNILQRQARVELTRSFTGGFGLHLLAVYLLEGIDEIVNRETIALGKYYLRTAWLFRDTHDIFLDEKKHVEKLLAEVKLYWPEVPLDETACLLRAAELLETGLETSTLIETTRDEIELILLIARIWMKAGDVRKAKNFGVFSRDKLAKYEAQLASAEVPKSAEQASEVQRLKISQNAVLNILADFTA